MVAIVSRMWWANLKTFNTLRPRQNGRRFADDTFKRIFLNENVRISIKISLTFVTKGPINNNPALIQIMAWRRSGDKPLSEPMMVSLLTHIDVTRPQWVKTTVDVSHDDKSSSVLTFLSEHIYRYRYMYLFFRRVIMPEGYLIYATPLMTLIYLYIIWLQECH